MGLLAETEGGAIYDMGDDIFLITDDGTFIVMPKSLLTRAAAALTKEASLD